MRMKKRSFLRLLLLVLVAAAALTSCGSCGVPAMKYDSSQGGYVRDDNVVFVRAPKNYVAVAINDEECLAVISNGDSEIKLYPMYGGKSNQVLDKSKWMADGDYNVYYDKGTALPMLWEMAIDRVLIMDNSNASFAMASITDVADVNALVTLYQSGDGIAFKELQTSMALLEYKTDYNKYKLAFASNAYDGMYYMLTYYRFESDLIIEAEDGYDSSLSYGLRDVAGDLNLGKNIILDPTTGICYSVDGIFDEHFGAAG